MSSLFHTERDIFYFGYGPVVNAVVRNRRGVGLSDEQAALLPEHRLTFNYGGVANVIEQRGYEVHGIVMKVGSLEDWRTLYKCDAGYYEIKEVEVFPYDDPDTGIKAYTLVMTSFDRRKLDSKIEKLPQERYLKLIAQGMRAFKIDEDYIQDQIMAVPFIPSRKQENWLTFPCADTSSSSRSSNDHPVAGDNEDHDDDDSNFLPRITYKRYLQMCKNSNPNEIYIIIKQNVVRLYARDPTNPGARWYQDHAHGKGDVTLALHKLVVDPDIPMVNEEEHLTDLHYRWAENHTCEFLGQCGVSMTKMYVLNENATETNGSSKPWYLLLCCRSSAIVAVEQNAHARQDERRETRLGASTNSSAGTTNGGTQSDELTAPANDEDHTVVTARST